MKQNIEGHESAPAPNDIAEGVRGSNVQYGKTLDGAKGAQMVGKRPDPPYKPGKSS